VLIAEETLDFVSRWKSRSIEYFYNKFINLNGTSAGINIFE